MFGRDKKRGPWSMANDIAREVSRRGFPTTVRTVTVMSAEGNIQRHAIAIPGRGVAVVNPDLTIVVASSNRPLPWNPKFECGNTEAAAENILRNLPLP